MRPVKLLGRAAGTAVHVIRHPVSSAAYAAGLARGLAGAARHRAAGAGHAPEAGATPVPTQRESAEPTTASAPREPQRVMKPVPEPGDLPEPIVIAPGDEEPGESFATEPKAVSRESAHGGGDARDAEIDAWEDEAADGLDVGQDEDVETDVPQSETPGLLDPSVAKAVRSESEILRRAAEGDPE